MHGVSAEVDNWACGRTASPEGAHGDEGMTDDRRNPQPVGKEDAQQTIEGPSTEKIRTTHASHHIKVTYR